MEPLSEKTPESTLRCTRGCCTLHVRPDQRNVRSYTHTGYDPIYHRRPKAGVFLYNPFTQRVLLVQSYGRKWGPPKGSVEHLDSDLLDCARRELLEETGIVLSRQHLMRARLHVIDRTHHFFLETTSHSIALEKCDQEITGIGWISVGCIEEMVAQGRMEVNYHGKRCLATYFRINCDRFGNGGCS